MPRTTEWGGCRHTMECGYESAVAGVSYMLFAAAAEVYTGAVCGRTRCMWQNKSPLLSVENVSWIHIHEVVRS